MTMHEQIKLFAQRFDVTQEYAKQCFADVGEFILDMASAGEKIQFPGILSIDVQEQKPRTVYDFQTKEKRTYPAKMKPVLKAGAKLKVAAAEGRIVKKEAD